ncbi:MAG: S41 family peptidase [Steroidobacteraceae bacterium]
MTLRSRMVLVLAVGVLIGVSLSLTANVLAARHPEAAPRIESGNLPWEDARLFAEVLGRIENEYVDSVDDHELMENAVRGMVAGLDSHSAFLDSEEYDEMQASTAGSYPGIGIEVATGDHGVKVLRPIQSAPAERAGIRAGDLIVKIDGVAVDANVDDAIVRMRGKAGTSVGLTVKRSGVANELQFVVKRTQVEVHSVSSQMLEPGYGYVRITHFSETTAEDVHRAVRDLKKKSARLSGLVLDLRNNPGGLLDSAVQIADDFLGSGNIVSAAGRADDARFRMDAEPGDIIAKAPIAVLVNAGSASAAEILAGALRDNDRATLIGKTTYGKGSVQTVIPLSEGRAIKITTSRYFTPSGASINEIGIRPDIIYQGSADESATLPVGRDPQVSLALDTLKRVPRLAAGGATSNR